jgi:hypothetical protein
VQFIAFYSSLLNLSRTNFEFFSGSNVTGDIVSSENIQERFLPNIDFVSLTITRDSVVQFFAFDSSLLNQ